MSSWELSFSQRLAALEKIVLPSSDSLLMENHSPVVCFNIFGINYLTLIFALLFFNCFSM